LALNVFGLIGLMTAVGLFGALGTWAMSHQPIHFALFIWIIILSVLLVTKHAKLFLVMTKLHNKLVHLSGAKKKIYFTKISIIMKPFFKARLFVPRNNYQSSLTILVKGLSLPE
jgi:hypothetical protein